LPRYHEEMSSPSNTPKQRILELVSEQPDDSSFDEILHELAFARMIERGLQDARAGRVVSHEDAVRESETWRK
jgi:predicted transcriptional regulator